MKDYSTEYVLQMWSNVVIENGTRRLDILSENQKEAEMQPLQRVSSSRIVV